MRPRYSILRPGPAIGCHSNCRLRGAGGLVAGTLGRRWGRRVCWLCAVVWDGDA